MEKRTSSLALIWFFFKQYKLRVLQLLILSLLVGGLEAATVAAVYPILSAAFETGIGEGNIALSLFRDMANLLPVADKFIAYCFLFLLFALLAFIVKLFSIRYRVTFSARLVEKNQNEIFSKFIKADLQYFIDHKEGELIYNTGTAPQGLARLVTSTTEFISQLILAISVLLFLFSLSWQGTIAVLVMGLVHYLFTRYLAEKVSYHSGKIQMEAARESNVILNETIGGIKQVKVFATADERINRFYRTMKRIWDHYIRNYTWQQALSPILMVVLYLFIGMIAVMIRIVAPTSFNVLIPVFGTFALAVFRLVPAMGGISNSTMQIMGALPNCETVYHILSEKLTKIEDGDKELDSFKSKIEFDKVTFAYKGRVKVLEDVSVTFEKGKTTAIVGRSGSGKTTVINLLLRLFDVDEGEVKIDGLNIKQYKSVSWLDKIGFVSQETFIFNDTIKNNITFGSKYPDEEVVRAARYADAHSFLTELPDGYDTPVGDKGIRLSGGQRQRIAVARAMIRDPEILIFDEATNALDNISEAAVQKAIDEIAKDHTVIVIAHRLSTIVNADKIIVLGDGQVLEEGTHKELMAKGGAYCELYQRQPV
jgi:ABC-type multidrug transport system fused ATPase/permease subunit